MNKYEKHESSKRPLLGKFWRRNDRGGWDEPICRECAIATLEAIGRCDHMDYIREEFTHRGDGVAYFSICGAGLCAIDGVAPVCGHGGHP